MPATQEAQIMDDADLPVAAMGRRRGWQGEELEIQHQKEGKDSNVVAAVDIRQFQNVQVGQGYQARHVVRQPSAQTASTAPVMQDMSQPAPKAKEESEKHPYLDNKALRDFRREIEKILSS